MISRMEYQSRDGRRTATVLWVSEKRWHVLLRHGYVSAHQARSRWCQTLTKAQAIAREWVNR